jgi:hypothetical protein
MTEGFLSRSAVLRLIESFAVAALVASAGFAASTAIAGDAQYAGPSTTPPTPAAVPDAGGPNWTDLSPAHRKVLAPLASEWNGLDARSKERWIDVAGRFPKLPPDEQQRAIQRMGEWSRMTVAERTQARMNFQATRGLSKEEREARWKAYQALPEEKKRELAAKRAAAAAGGASAVVAGARRKVSPSLDTVQPKNNLIGASASAHSAAGSAPAAAPQRSGVTATLLTRRATPPAHQHDGSPKIAIGPNAVDRKTLLPKHTTVAAASTAASGPAAVHR